MTNCMSLDMFYTVLVVSKSPSFDCSLNRDHISIIMMMLQLSFVQPCMNGLTKSDKIAATMIGNTDSTVCLVVSFEILTIQVVKFVEFPRYMSLFKIYRYKDEYDITTSQLF